MSPGLNSRIMEIWLAVEVEEANGGIGLLFLPLRSGGRSLM